MNASQLSVASRLMGGDARIYCPVGDVRATPAAGSVGTCPTVASIGEARALAALRACVARCVVPIAGHRGPSDLKPRQRSLAQDRGICSMTW